MPSPKNSSDPQIAPVDSSPRAISIRRMSLAAAALCCSLCCGLLIQPAISEPPGEQPLSGLHPLIPAVPSKLESPSLRFTEASSFIERLSKNDASFEVIVGHGRTLTFSKELQQESEEEATPPSVSVGDPMIADFVVVGNRNVRVFGKRVGITDLSISTSNGKTYSYELHVVLDLKLLEARLLQLFPDAHVRLAHLGSKLVVEGQARDTVQLRQISEVLNKVVATSMIVDPKASGQTITTPTQSPSAAGDAAADADATNVPIGAGSKPISGDTTYVEIINLLKVPGPQQVMLQVQVAELNRTAMRQIGSDLLFTDGHGMTLGTRLNSVTDGGSSIVNRNIVGAAAATATGAAPTTAFGIFEGVGFHTFLSALRKNTVLKILAEPNLVAMHGHQANFLAGGEFPVPVPQSGAGGGPATITIQYKKFGVQLAFVPYVLDGDLIRMEVDPEVSSIDFELGTEISGVKVPGINTRRSHTVVEMREGQTLAIAGLMQLDLAGNTSRIPGLGDLPYIGPFFSNTTGKRVEKELVVLVTPHLVEAMSAEQVGPLPGEEVYEPNDLEFYLLNRIEGHTRHAEFRSTINGEDPWGCSRRMKLECHYIQGPHGFSE